MAARAGMERLPEAMRRQARRGLRQASEIAAAGKAAPLLCYLASRPGTNWAGVAAAILEGLAQRLAVTKPGLPPEPRRSLACTNIIGNIMGPGGVARPPERNIPAFAVRWRGVAYSIRGI